MTSVAAESSWIGAFSPVAFTNVLKRVADEGRSGELQIVSGNWIKTIRVDDGAVRFAKSNMRQDRLGESMLAHEGISENDYRLASERMTNDRCRFGEALLKMGRLNRKQLHRELGVQVQRIVLSLFRFSGGLYSFEEGETAGIDDAPLPFSLSVPPLLLKGLRRVDDGRLILSALPPADTVVRMAERPVYNFDLSKLAQLERNVLEKAGDGATIGSLVRDASLERSAALRACYALVTLGLLEIADDNVPSAAPPEDEAVTRELIESQFGRLEQTADHDLLGVKKNASEADVCEAYESLTSEWTELREQTQDRALVEKIDAIELQLTTAYHQLLAERDRAREREQAEPADAELVPQEPAQDGLVAQAAPEEDTDEGARGNHIEQLERDAELHLQVEAWDGAISILHELVALAPANAAYQLMLGQAMQFHPTLEKTAEEHFLQAVSLAPNDARTHVALGRYYQLTKKHASAITELERALEIDPMNEDAKRYLEKDSQPTRMSKLVKKIFG